MVEPPENFIEEERRPWGRFRIYMHGGNVNPDSVQKFFREIYSAYSLDATVGALDFMNDAMKHAAEGQITVKIIEIFPNSRLSLQYHNERSEDWLCLIGPAGTQIGPEKSRGILNKGDHAHIGKKMLHRLENGTDSKIAILEVGVGKFREDDIVRIEDDYSRK